MRREMGREKSGVAVERLPRHGRPTPSYTPAPPCSLSHARRPALAHARRPALSRARRPAPSHARSPANSHARRPAPTALLPHTPAPPCSLTRPPPCSSTSRRPAPSHGSVEKQAEAMAGARPRGCTAGEAIQIDHLVKSRIGQTAARLGERVGVADAAAGPAAGQAAESTVRPPASLTSTGGQRV
jgi:hypothetical protein